MIYKYLLEGAPGSGKSKSIKILIESLSKKGYEVYVVEEGARKLIEKKIIDRDSDEFPYYNFLLMTYNELTQKKKAAISKKDAIILCDRGLLDSKAYRGEQVFNSILKNVGIVSEEDIMKSYDGVIFLQTPTDKDKYVNDGVRIESHDKSVALQNKLYDVWGKHEYCRYIGNSENFEDKVEKVEEAILDLINEKSQKLVGQLSAKEIIEYADGLTMSDREMLKLATRVLREKKIIDKNNEFEF